VGAAGGKRLACAVICLMRSRTCLAFASGQRLFLSWRASPARYLSSAFSTASLLISAVFRRTRKAKIAAYHCGCRNGLIVDLGQTSTRLSSDAVVQCASLPTLRCWKWSMCTSSIRWLSFTRLVLRLQALILPLKALVFGGH